MSNTCDEQVNGYKIEDGIPIPDRGKRGNSITGAIRALKPGQSVFFLGMSAESLGSRISYLRVQLKPATFTQRTVDGGVRVWRVT